jgi:hypothetical protein
VTLETPSIIEPVEGKDMPSLSSSLGGLALIDPGRRTKNSTDSRKTNDLDYPSF